MPRSTTRERLEFFGPFRIVGEQVELKKLPNEAGIYIWCVQSADAFYRVHYVGEAAKIDNRTYQHARNQMKGKYHAYSPEHLRRNTKVLVHRAGYGVVPKFKDKIRPKKANRDYLNCLSVFYATLPEHVEKHNRCQFETAVGHAIEDWGQNILAVGRLNKRAGRLRSFEIDTDNSVIEGLTGQVLSVFELERR